MKKKESSFLQEFKDFALKGNVMDLAIGVIIGGAFNAIVTSLVKDVVMPLFGTLTGGVNFQSLSYVLKPAEGKHPAILLNYGIFIQNIVNFLIIALSIFVFIKVVSKLNKKKEEIKEEAIASLTPEQELLTEIRDLLKDKK